MTAWNLLYQNSFPAKAVGVGRILDDFRSTPGEQEIQSGPVVLMHSALPGFGISEGRFLAFSPARELRDIIGLEVLLDLSLMSPLGDTPLTIYNDSSHLSIDVQRFGPPSASGKHTIRLSCRLNGTTTIIDGIALELPEFNQPAIPKRVQVRWMTSGQLHVFVNGQLLAYENNVAAGNTLRIDQIRFGDDSGEQSGFINLVLTNCRVLMLRREDALGALVNEVPLHPVPEEIRVCAQDLMPQVLGAVDAAFELMANFNQTETQAWRKGAPSPFSSSALELHNASEASGEAFTDYMRTGGADAMKKSAAEMLRVFELLRENHSAEFDALAAQLLGIRDNLPEDCVKLAEKLVADDPKLNEKLENLSDALSTGIDALREN